MTADGVSTGDRRAVAQPTAPPEPEAIAELVRSLIGMMHGGGITELDLTFGGVALRLRGQPAAPAVAAEPPVVAALASPPADHLITAPMIGTFYASSSPGAPPFVEVGQRIEVGQVIGVIEAMKIMNEITADCAGVVTAVLVGNAQAVEYGSPLIRLDGGGEPA